MTMASEKSSELRLDTIAMPENAVVDIVQLPQMQRIGDAPWLETSEFIAEVCHMF